MANENFVIFTDSGCDISADILKEWDVLSLDLTFRFEGEDKEYSNADMPVKKFYDRMRGGEVAKTSAINTATFEEAFEALLKQGKDLLYLGFSSGLSTTYNCAKMAAAELAEKYPDNKIITVDTLAASAGQGLLVYMAVQKRQQGESIESVAEYIEGIKLNLCHWFTVDDLVYLKRGGRVSAAAAIVGTVLNIKPVLHVDNDGHLISKAKVRGRKATLKMICDKYGELAVDKKDGTVFICHADCMEDVETVKEMLFERYGAKVQVVTDVGAVIGAHSGPGTLALFFIGSER